jgi:uncharacterized protein (TIGR03435 family)
MEAMYKTILALLLCAGLPAASLAQGKAVPALEKWKIQKVSGEGDTELQATSLRSEGLTLRRLTAIAYGKSPALVEGPAQLDKEYYEVEAVAKDADNIQFQKLLQQALAAHFGLQARLEKKDRDAYILGRAEGRPAPKTGSGKPGVNMGAGRLETSGVTMPVLARALQLKLKAPVVDETALQGVFALQLEWDEGDAQSLGRALASAGLELTRGKRSIEYLIVEQLRVGR